MYIKAYDAFAIRLTLSLVLILGMTAVQPVRPVLAATLVVTNANDSGAGSLRQAIISASPHDTITFHASLSGQIITLGSALVIDKNLIINGSGLSSRLSISGNNDVTVIIVNQGVAATLDSLIIKNGRSNASGAGIYNSGSLTVRNSFFSGNSLVGPDAFNGGAIANHGTLVVTGTTFSTNNAVINPYFLGIGEGGAIYSQGSLTVRNSTFTGNNASRGGAISCTQGGMVITDTTFSSNQALSSSGGDGGAIFNSTACSATIENSTFSGNTAAHYGGAILTDDGISQSKIINSTFYGNSSQSGGGVANYGALSITNSTFSGNSSPSGGALRNGLGGTLSIRNSILANSVGGVDCSKSDSAPAVENIHNLIETTGMNLSSCGTSLLTGDPLLGPLQNNGGSTQTMALGAGSPAIDAGNNTYCPSTDQRGVPRPQGGYCDIGAYELKELITVTIAATERGSYSLARGESQRVSYLGVNAGPVKIAHRGNTSLIAAERVIFKFNGIPTSFSEMMGLPDSQLDTTYWLPWYNNVDLDTQLRFANVSNSTATVQLFIGGQEKTSGCTPSSSPYTLAAGASLRVSCAGVNGGPVQIVSTQNIVAAERVIYKVNRVHTSFSEIMALPNRQLSTTYWLPWYNNVDLDTQLRFANVSNQQAIVRLFIGGQEKTSGCTPSNYPYILAPKASLRVSCPGVNNGPVQIVSTQNIVAAERVIYKVNNIYTSFSEMMALPDNLLNTTYWLPWYNNVDLDTQLRFANVSDQPATVRLYIGGVEKTGGCTPSSSPFTLAAGASLRVSCAGVNNGPVEIRSTQNIVAAERVIYKVNNVYTSFSEMMGLPDGLLDTTYWLPWYNNVDLDTQLRFGIP